MQSVIEQNDLSELMNMVCLLHSEYACAHHACMILAHADMSTHHVCVFKHRVNLMPALKHMLRRCLVLIFFLIKQLQYGHTS